MAQEKPFPPVPKIHSLMRKIGLFVDGMNVEGELLEMKKEAQEALRILRIMFTAELKPSVNCPGPLPEECWEISCPLDWPNEEGPEFQQE